MARNPIIRERLPMIPAPAQEQTPHGCYEGFVYIGHMLEDKNGEEVEVFEAVACRRCNATSSETL